MAAPGRTFSFNVATFADTNHILLILGELKTTIDNSIPHTTQSSRIKQYVLASLEPKL
jgi:hypothetical protein